MNEDLLDKQIIIIDSNEGFFYDTTLYDFYIDIYTPIKNVCLIKIIESSLIINDLYKETGDSAPKGLLNNNDIVNYDNIYINMNNYNRLTTTNKTLGTSASYFDLITIDKSKYIQDYYVKKSNSSTSTVALTYNISNDHKHDDTTFIINPIEPSLKRFNIVLYDKNFTKLLKSNTSRFTMKLCIYHNRKKLTNS